MGVARQAEGKVPVREAGSSWFSLLSRFLRATHCFVFEYAISVHCLLKEGSFGTPSVEGTVCALTSASRHSFIRWN